MEENPKITDLNIYSSKNYPMLVFEYKEQIDSKKKKRSHLGQVLKELRKMK